MHEIFITSNYIPLKSSHSSHVAICDLTNVFVLFSICPANGHT